MTALEIVLGGAICALFLGALFLVCALVWDDWNGRVERCLWLTESPNDLVWDDES